MTASHPRVSLVVKADIRPGHTGQLSSKVDRIESLLAETTDARSDPATSGALRRVRLQYAPDPAKCS